ncbi:type II toxin-antitoxin system VapC family toxin [Nakamurella leprariae]|uniref:Ribonuclease VapC n=1 Tax=Nakamurella leprariae TaxID=2803911 RepID=A0A938YAR4_9ACTN|nr:type II toxin-antitoxin system VapC family toxin [Nakamurella leprariae]MBM9466339.1 type II toxin-antitoxin system VapC family toxin [Nakamurella leprariae]
MIVVDASVLAPALADDGPDGDQARGRLRGEVLAAPQVIDLEVTSVLRRAAANGSLPDRRAALALADLVALPVRRVEHRQLLERCWGLRHTVTPYDAAYVALAEALGVVLVTADARLSRAPGIRCDVEVLR